MPFEFVCPFCYTKTKVADEYLGDAGPCVHCGRHVVMPTRNENGVLVASVQTGKAPRAIQSPPSPAQRAMVLAIGLAVATLFIGTIIGALWFVMPGIQRGFSVAAQRKDIDNMRVIVEALNDYSARYGTYPPPVVTDANGRKLYSWRVLILPFMGYEDLHKRFQLDQPWDSPANQSLVREMPTAFASPNSDQAKQNNEPNYVLIVGPNTVFPPAGPLSKSQVVDSPTILLVETLCDGIVWTQPGDIDISLGAVTIGNKGMKTIGGHHRDHVVVMDCDAKGYRIPKDTPQSVIDAMITPTVGERVNAASFED
jgi:hypothetical protein